MKPQYPVACPTCGAEPRISCRTLISGRVTDTHMARIGAAADALRAEWQAQERAQDERPS